MGSKSGGVASARAAEGRGADLMHNADSAAEGFALIKGVRGQHHCHARSLLLPGARVSQGAALLSGPNQEVPHRPSRSGILRPRPTPFSLPRPQLCLVPSPPSSLSPPSYTFLVALLLSIPFHPLFRIFSRSATLRTPLPWWRPPHPITMSASPRSGESSQPACSCTHQQLFPGKSPPQLAVRHAVGTRGAALSALGTRGAARSALPGVHILLETSDEQGPRAKADQPVLD